MSIFKFSSHHKGNLISVELKESTSPRGSETAAFTLAVAYGEKKVEQQLSVDLATGQIVLSTITVIGVVACISACAAAASVRGLLECYPVYKNTGDKKKYIECLKENGYKTLGAAASCAINCLV